jgi:tRNA A37 threonylcarbamoyladenosine modification protein TsaB
MYSKGNVKTKTPKEKVASVLNATVDEVYWKLHTTSSTQESLENEGKEVEKGDE